MMLTRVGWRKDKGENDEDGCHVAKDRTVGELKVMLGSGRTEQKQDGDLREGEWK